MQPCISHSSRSRFGHLASSSWPHALRQVMAIGVLSLLAAAAFPFATFSAPGSGC